MPSQNFLCPDGIERGPAIEPQITAQAQSRRNLIRADERENQSWEAPAV